MARIPSRRVLVLAFGATVTVAVVAHLRAAKRRGEPAAPSSVPGASGDGVASPSEAVVGVAEVVEPAATKDVADVVMTPVPSSAPAGSEAPIIVVGPAPGLPPALATERAEPALELEPVTMEPECEAVVVQPEPVVEAEPEQIVEAELPTEQVEREAAFASELEIDVEPAFASELEIDVEPAFAPELEIEVTAEPAIDVEPADGPAAQPVVEFEPMSEARPASDSEPELPARPVVEPEPVLEPEPAHESVASVEVEMPARETRAVVASELTEADSTRASYEVGHETAEPESWEWVAAGDATVSGAEAPAAEDVAGEPARPEDARYAGPWRRAADLDPLAVEDSAYDGPQRRSSDGNGERARLLAAAIAEQHAEEDARREERAKRPPAAPMADRPSVEIVVLTGPLAEDL